MTTTKNDFVTDWRNLLLRAQDYLNWEDYESFLSQVENECVIAKQVVSSARRNRLQTSSQTEEQRQEQYERDDLTRHGMKSVKS